MKVGRSDPRVPCGRAPAYVFGNILNSPFSVIIKKNGEVKGGGMPGSRPAFCLVSVCGIMGHY